MDNRTKITVIIQFSCAVLWAIIAAITFSSSNSGGIWYSILAALFFINGWSIYKKSQDNKK